MWDWIVSNGLPVGCAIVGAAILLIVLIVLLAGTTP